MRVNRYIPFWVDMSVGTPVDESKGLQVMPKNKN